MSTSSSTSSSPSPFIDYTQNMPVMATAMIKMALTALYRIMRALEAYPNSADDITNRRWAHGIAREMVSNICSP